MRWNVYLIMFMLYFRPIAAKPLPQAGMPAPNMIRPEYHYHDEGLRIITLSGVQKSLNKPIPNALAISAATGIARFAMIDNEFGVIIEIPWLRHKWIIAIMIIALLIIIAIIIRVRLRNALRANDILEEKIRERTQILQQTVLRLKSSQDELQKRDRLHIHILASISHDFRSPLKQIHCWVHTIPSLLEQSKIDSLSQSSQIVEEALANMMHLTDDMTSYIKATSSDVLTEIKQHHLAALVRDKTILFSTICALKQGSILIDIDPKLIIKTNGSLMGILIHNLVDNALKANPQGEVAIHALQLEGLQELQLLVADQGPGMPSELVRWLNSPLGNNTLPPKTYQGLGLSMIKSICELIHVSIKIHVNPGTTVVLTIPQG